MLVGILAFGFAGTAKADSFDFTVTGNNGGVALFVATVTSTDVTINVSCLDVTCQGFFLSTVGLKGLSFTAVTDDPAGDPAGFSKVLNGGTNLGQTGDCDGTQLGSSVCWTTTLPNGAGTPLQVQIGASRSTQDCRTAPSVARRTSASDGKLTVDAEPMKGCSHRRVRTRLRRHPNLPAWRRLAWAAGCAVSAPQVNDSTRTYIFAGDLMVAGFLIFSRGRPICLGFAVCMQMVLTPYDKLPSRKPLSNHTAIQAPAAFLAMLAGRYGTQSAVLTVEAEGDHLSVAEDGKPGRELFPQTWMIFFSKESNETLTFLFDMETWAFRMPREAGGKYDLIPILEWARSAP